MNAASADSKTCATDATKHNAQRGWEQDLPAFERRGLKRCNKLSERLATPHKLTQQSNPGHCSFALLSLFNIRYDIRLRVS